MSRLKKRGFTLVELLVVIAIMAVLMAILLPSLSRAKKVAKAGRCLASTRSMGQSLVLYMSDRQQNVPYNFTAQNAWTAILKDYGNTDKLRACPEVIEEPLAGNALILPGSVTRPWNVPSSDPKYIAIGAFAFNGWLHATGSPANAMDQMLGYANNSVPAADKATGSSFHKLPFVGTAQSQIPVFAESAWPDGWPMFTNVAPRDLSSGIAYGQTSVDSNANAHMSRFCLDRHNKSINVGFADNHAETVKLIELWSLRWNARWKPMKAPSPWPQR